MKPSGLLYANGTLYAGVGNIKTDGTQSRLRYATSNPLAPPTRAGPGRPGR